MPVACCARLPLPPISHRALTALAAHTLRPHCWDCSPVPNVPPHNVRHFLHDRLLSRLVSALPTNLPKGDEPHA